MEDGIAKKVLDAAESSEIDVKVRNKLYSAISRMLQRPGVSPHVLARWEAAGDSRIGKFSFLKEWVKDTSCGELVRKEIHLRRTTKYTDDQKVWATKMQVYAWYHAHTSPDAKKFVDDMCVKAVSKPNPDKKYKADPRFRVFHVPYLNLTGSKDEAGRQTQLEVEGTVSCTTEEEAKALETYASSLGDGLETQAKPPKPDQPNGDTAMARAKTKAKTKTKAKAKAKASVSMFRAWKPMVAKHIQAGIDQSNLEVDALAASDSRYKDTGCVELSLWQWPLSK